MSSEGKTFKCLVILVGQTKIKPHLLRKVN